MNHVRISVQAQAANRSRLPAAGQLLGIFVAAVLLVLPATATAQTPPAALAAAPQADYQCFYPVADTYADSTSPNDNSGGAPTIIVQHTDVGQTIKSAYLRFDLSPIPSGSTILSAPRWLPL